MPSGKEYVLKNTEADSEMREASPNGAVRSSTESASKGRVPQKGKGVKLSDREITEISGAEYQQLVNHFGTTRNYDVAGYLLGNGAMLDFSGKHWGDDYSDTRQVDHRDVWDVWQRKDRDGVDEMVNMIGNGNIRFMPENRGINLAVMPTDGHWAHQFRQRLPAGEF